MRRSLFPLFALLLGCPDEEPATPTGADADTDADTDTDTDTDADADTDTDVQRRVFFAAEADGALGGPTGADARCQTDAGNPDSGATWKALLGSSDRVPCAEPDCASGTTGQVDWVLAPDTAYGLADGTFLFRTDANGISADTLPVDLDGSAFNFWTGLRNDWTVLPDTCSGWTVNDTGMDGRLGWTQSRDDATWLDGGTFPCSSSVPFLCVEQ